MVGQTNINTCRVLELNIKYKSQNKILSKFDEKVILFPGKKNEGGKTPVIFSLQTMGAAKLCDKNMQKNKMFKKLNCMLVFYYTTSLNVLRYKIYTGKT